MTALRYALILPFVLLLAACEASGGGGVPAPARVAVPVESAAAARLAAWTRALETPLGDAGDRGLAKTEAEAAAAVEAARSLLADTRARLAATRARVVQARLPRSALDGVIADGRGAVATMRRAVRATAARRGALAPSVDAPRLAVLDRRARELGELAAALEAEL